MSTTQESSRTSDDSLASSSSLARDTIIPYSEIEDSSIIDTSITNINNGEKLRNAPSSKQGVRSPFYRRKRFWAMCLAINVVLSAIFVPLLYLVIIPSVAQSTINNSKLGFKAINITNETNDSFVATMLGETSHAGPFNAKIEFDGPVAIFYNDVQIGKTKMSDVSVSKGKGDLVGTSQVFNIQDKTRFANFAVSTMTEESFKWTIKGTVNIQTFGTKIKNLKLNKEVIIPGSNGYNTTLVNLNINQNPDKTLSLEAVSTLHNPSPIGIDIGDMNLLIIYNGTVIANGTTKNLFINTGDNIFTVTAISALPTTDADRDNYVKVINGYLTNTPVATTVKVLSIESSNGRVDWLNEAAQHLNLITKVGQSKAPQLINGVDFGEMNMKFTADAPFSPTFSAKNTNAQLKLPFNIEFKILSVSQSITLFYKGNPVATIEIPETNVTTTDTGIALDIPEIQMKVDKDSEDPFKDFLTSITTGTGSDVNIVGTSNARVTTVIGENIPIQGIPFNVSSNIQGFNQFNSGGGPPAVSNITILSGSTNELIIGAVVSLINPSRFSTSIGQVSFNLFYREQQIGNVVIPDLTVVPGPNPLAVVITLTDPDNNAGKELITAFLTNQPITLDIRGSDDSTNIASLVPAFKAIDISTTLPPILQSQQLVAGTKLVVDNQTSTTKGLVQIANTFVAPISIYTMNSSFSFNGNILGTYEQEMTTNPIFIPGNTVQSLELDVNMNSDPVASLSMLRTLALQNNMDVSVLDSLIVLSKVNVPGVDPNVQPTPEAIKSFNLVNFVTTALAKFTVTINLDSRVAVGNYFMSLNFQQDVTVETDQTVVGLISKFAQPIISQIMGQSQMSFSSVVAYNIDVASLDVYAEGQVSNTGPLPAEINFPNGLDISASGVALGKMVNMPPITVDPIAGTNLKGTSRFQIADVPTFTSFTEALMSVDEIELDISGDIVISSFGAPIGPIPIKQSIPTPGFNILSQGNQAKMNAPQFSGAGFSLNVDLNNPTTFGIELGKVVFSLSLNNNPISTVTGDDVVILPKRVSTITIHGPLDLSNPNVIPDFISGAPVTIQGVSITPPKATGEVVWLTQPFANIKLTVPASLGS